MPGVREARTPHRDFFVRDQSFRAEQSRCSRGAPDKCKVLAQFGELQGPRRNRLARRDRAMQRQSCLLYRCRCSAIKFECHSLRLNFRYTERDAEYECSV